MIDTPSSKVTDAKKLLAHPLVLKAAWTRVEHWFRGSELVPQPELANWKLYPESEIRNLRAELLAGEWRPSPWLQVPYPKKDSCLRHYTMPTVKDQVAFMAHMVLLGPLLDAKTHNFVFGNRWYRPIRWDRFNERWVHPPFPFYAKTPYLPYARSHGLFRRVASWTVRRMTSAKLERHTYSGVVQHPNEYEAHYLPRWVHEEWWKASSEKSVAYWCTLDIQLAYPSAGLEELGTLLHAMLQNSDHLDQQLSGYPQSVMNRITDAQVRLEIANHLLNSLQHVKIEPGPIEIDSWKPRHAKVSCNGFNSYGLPTGLAISGLLLNVALYAADSHIMEYLSSQRDERRGAFLRFADDMTLFSRSTSGLFDLIEEVWKGVSGDSNARFDRPKSTYKFFLNVGKTGPDAIHDVLVKYLQHQGWKKCRKRKTGTKHNKHNTVDGDADACEELQPPDDSDSPPAISISDWWEARNDDEKGQKQLYRYLQAVERSAVGPHEAGPFVTTLVERLSEIGKDTLGDRFGEGAHERLVQLHDLARFNIADDQVRPDTRRAFAVNRLVSAWLSSDTKEARAQLEDIRDSVANVVQETPWKSALWRAVVRAAARRPPLTGDSTDDADTAREWLLTQLRKIATEQGGSGGGTTWHSVWPEAEPRRQHRKPPSWREQYLSFVRTAFWNALADTMLYLRRYHYRSTNPRIADAGLSPSTWVARAIPDAKFDRVAEHLRALDRWARTLYSKDSAYTELAQFPWELDSLVTAVLASRQRHEIAQAWLHSEPPGDKLMIPEALDLSADTLVYQILEHSGRIQPLDEKDTARLLDRSALASVLLGAQDSKLGDFLFPLDGPSRINESGDLPSFVLSAANSLGCSGSIGPNRIKEIVPELDDLSLLIPHFQKDPLLLSEYGLARSLLLGSEERNGSKPTLQRLLWGVPTENRLLADWRIRAWEIPAVGLPTRVATFLFRKVKVCSEDPASRSTQLPTTWRILTKRNSVADGRMLQFDIAGDSHIDDRVAVDIYRTNAWEIPPHPAYFLPFVMNDSVEPINDASFAHYCDVLLLLTAMDGGESILWNIVDRGVGTVPFTERWNWRSRIHLPADAWRATEALVSWAYRPHSESSGDRSSLEDSIRKLTPGKLHLRDFRLERIDLSLETQRDGEIIRDIQGTSVGKEDLLEQLWLHSTQASDSLAVRIGQIAASPSQQCIKENFPRMEFHESHQIMEQVYQIFNSPTSGEHSPHQNHIRQGVDLVVFPELAIPVSEVSTVQQYVERTGRSSLAGLFWRELSPVYRDPSNKGRHRRWFVNEAELVISMNHNGPGPNFTRSYRIRKALPAHIECGLAKALSKGPEGAAWKMLKGGRWYRFVHPKWGDFSIAICADLLDSTPWRSLRGELLHLLMVAYNKDIELYQSLTWTRAYENYVNLVAVNHGRYGGSFIWTPRRSHSREVATLRGQGLFLFADVNLPVRGLIGAQREGVVKAIDRAREEWSGNGGGSSDYKSPPPGFSRGSIK